MLKKFMVALTALSVTAIARAGGIPAAEQEGLLSLRQIDLKADLYFLASDPLQGRMSLENGDEVAIRWIAAEFAKAGLQAPVQDASGHPTYLQAVPLLEFRGDRATSFLKFSRDGQNFEWRRPDIIGGFRDDIEITAPVVFAGYGISAPGLGYDDYRGLDARGKIVVVFEHEPQETDPHSRFFGTGNTRYATNRMKALNAQAHGARALLVVAEPNRKHPSNLDRVNRIGGSVTRANPIPAQVLFDDEVRIPTVTVGDAAGTELLKAAGMTPQALQAAIDKDLSNHSMPLPGSIATLHLDNKTRTTGTTYNVAGLLPGSDPKLAAETIMITAHHDHDGESPAADGVMQVWHGADDNGSGTVGVVALAHAFAVNRIKPKRSILFVVFGAEERGLLGSYYMAAHPLRPLATTRAMINFDMIGRDEKPSEQTDGLIEIPDNTSNRLNLIGGGYSPELRAAVAAANRSIALDLDDRFDHENALNTFFRSDQFPFVLHDVPAMWFFTGFHPDYHHITDTADKIDYPKMLRILQLSYLTAFALGNDAGHPAFVSDPPGS